MKKIVLICATIFMVLLVGCQDNWDDFYESDDDRKAGAEGTLYEVLQQYPKRYSKFLELVDKAEADVYLKSERVLTVWAPHNDHITDEIMALEGEDLKRFVMNHLNSLAMYKTKLASKNTLQMLSEKYVSVDRFNANYRIDRVPVARYDIAATNGVIHEISGTMIPLKNIMEYINEAGPEFSIFRDSLWSYNDTIFDPKASFPLGVNDVGQTIYDSVFVIQNSLLKTVDPGDESRELTLFLPSNAIIEDLIHQTSAYYEGIGRDFLRADSLSVYKWVMRAAFFDRQIENLSPYKSLTGVGGSIVRFDKQIVRTNFERSSNGVVYHYESMYMPRGGLLQPFEYYTSWLFELPEEVRGKYYNVFDNSVLNETDNIWFDNNAKDRLFLNIPSTGGQWIDLKPLAKNIDAEIIEHKVMPGKYQVSGRFYGYRGANTRIYVNGDPQTWYKDGSLTFPTGGNAVFEYGAVPILIDTLTVGERSGYNMLNIRFEHAGSGSANFIRVAYLKFEPVGDNY